VVHGDYGTHNVLIGRDAKVAAVVDWEIATLGDPLADFAYSMNAWVEADDPLIDKVDAASLAPGFPARDVLVERYAARTGSDLSDLPYYRAYNRFKSACIIHGVYARYRRGQKAIEPHELEQMRQRVLNGVKLAELAGNEIR
jgi:aminoglycoside phosphotransferase (APT) family kinase protein